MPRLIDADKFRLKLASIAKACAKTDAQKVLIGRCAYALEKTTTVSEWISVKDRLPDKAGIYIICDHYGNVMSRHFCKQHGRFAGYWHFNGSAKYGNPLYWMPLPEPPEVEE